MRASFEVMARDADGLLGVARERLAELDGGAIRRRWQIRLTGARPAVVTGAGGTVYWRADVDAYDGQDVEPTPVRPRDAAIVNLADLRSLSIDAEANIAVSGGCTAEFREVVRRARLAYVAAGGTAEELAP